MRGSMSWRAMIAALKGEEVVNSRHGGGIRALQAHLAAARQAIGRVDDARPSRRHHRRPGNVSIVYETGEREVAPTERTGNYSHVGPDLSDPGRVGGIPLESDAAAIGQRFEAMGGGVFI